jgi:hypothetical protein
MLRPQTQRDSGCSRESMRACYAFFEISPKGVSQSFLRAYCSIFILLDRSAWIRVGTRSWLHVAQRAALRQRSASRASARKPRLVLLLVPLLRRRWFCGLRTAAGPAEEEDDTAAHGGPQAPASSNEQRAPCSRSACYCWVLLALAPVVATTVDVFGATSGEAATR